MKSSLLSLLSFFLLASSSFTQDLIISNFDTDSDGWLVNGGIIHYKTSDGNPDGFIEFEDDQDGAGIFIAPNKFLGNLLLYKQGALAFDLKNTVNNGQNMLYGFGK